MNTKRNKILKVTLNVVSITLFVILFVLFEQLLTKLHYYYLFITIPMLFLSILMILISTIKLTLNIVSMIFGRNDNTEVSDYFNEITEKINRITKYSLIGIFTALLTSVMILDIILCIYYEKYLLIALSIVVWIMLYYILFEQVVKIIKKEIRL